MGLGPAGRLIGFLVGFLYFAIPESSFGHGQSIGKRVLKLQVVDVDGNPISIERSAIRYTIFAALWLLIGMALPVSRMLWPVVSPFGLAVFGLGAASVYLMVFNRNTRQGIHDLAAGCYVVQAGKHGIVTAHAIWKLHWVVAGVILALAAVVGILGQRQARRPPFAQLRDDSRQVAELPGVQSASIRRISTYRSGVKAISLLAEVRCTVSIADEEALANQVADSILTTDPAIQQYATVRVILIRGFDIGIAHDWFSQTYTDSPAGWKTQFFAVPPEFPAH